MKWRMLHGLFGPQKCFQGLEQKKSNELQTEVLCPNTKAQNHSLVQVLSLECRVNLSNLTLHTAPQQL